MALAGCVTEPVQRPQAKTVPSAPATPAAGGGPGYWAEPQVYDCGDGMRFTVAYEAQQAWLLLNGQSAKRLLPVASGSAGQYRGEGVLFWAQGDDAVLVLSGTQHTGCRPDPRASVWAKAKLQGVDFRALGNEPGWYLEIHEGERIVVVTDYGARWMEFAATAPERSPDGLVRYQGRAEGRQIRIEIESKPCTDSMSGEAFEASVRLWVDQQSYQGCGRRP